MALTKSQAGVDLEARENDKDTGSTEVRVAMLTRRISELGAPPHAPEGHYSRRGLLGLVHSPPALPRLPAAQGPRGLSRLIKELGLRR